MGLIIPASVVLVVHEERALLLRRRLDDRSFAGAWCLPGGRIDQGERPEEAATRETREETGLEVAIEARLGARLTALIRRGRIFALHRFVAAAPRSEVVLSEEHIDARWLNRDAARRAASLEGGLAGDVTRELLSRFASGDLPPKARPV